MYLGVLVVNKSSGRGGDETLRSECLGAYCFFEMPGTAIPVRHGVSYSGSAILVSFLQGTSADLDGFNCPAINRLIDNGA